MGKIVQESYRRVENHEVTLKFDTSEEMRKAIRTLAMSCKFEVSQVREWDYIVLKGGE